MSVQEFRVTWFNRATNKTNFYTVLYPSLTDAEKTEKQAESMFQIANPYLQLVSIEAI